MKRALEERWALRDCYLRHTIGFFASRESAETELLRQRRLGNPHLLEVVRRAV